MRRHGIGSWIALIVSSVFFMGFVGKLVRKPGKAGGTAGALVALAVQFWLLSSDPRLLVGLTIASFIAGWMASRPGETLMLELWGPRHRHTGEEVRGDFNETCIDEVHGQFLAALPLWFWHDWPGGKILWLVVAFVLFRICDAKKPTPVDIVERRFKGTGFGVMIDDTVAALFPFFLLVNVHIISSLR